MEATALRHPPRGVPVTRNFFIEAKGQTFFESVTSMGYEGIMAKRMELHSFTRVRERGEKFSYLVVRGHRILTGDHIRHPLCVHLRELVGKVELGYLPEDKYGGVLTTHDTIVIALQSSTVSSLDKGLRIRDPSLCVEYRSYIADLLSTSRRSLDNTFIKSLCKECSSEQESKGKER